MIASDNVFPKLKLSEVVAPATPASGEVVVYAKSDGMLYMKDDVGTETALGAGLTNPMTTAGDIIYGGVAGTPTRLAAGTNGHILTMVAGAPAYAAPAAPSLNATVTALSIASGVVNIDLSLGNLFTLALTANVTSITFSNAPGAGFGRSIEIRFKQDATGGRTVALPASFKATGGSDTAVESAADAYTILSATTFDAGTRWEYAMQDGTA